MHFSKLTYQNLNQERHTISNKRIISFLEDFIEDFAEKESTIKTYVFSSNQSIATVELQTLQEIPFLNISTFANIENKSEQCRLNLDFLFNTDEFLASLSSDIKLTDTLLGPVTFKKILDEKFDEKHQPLSEGSIKNLLFKNNKVTFNDLDQYITLDYRVTNQKPYSLFKTLSNVDNIRINYNGSNYLEVNIL